ncbi:MAG TPA: hypothetical protein VJ866_05590 [Pyrinomonadaceae bacterium]|nr:hypothetical protein [Pyrinomonadaceae bacterium]
MSSAVSSTVGRPETVRRGRTLRAGLAAAAALHLALAAAIFAVGRAQVLPSQFDANGTGSFAHDGQLYLPEVEGLAETLKREGPAAWAGRPSLLHLRLYSLPVALFGSGCNVLTVEPLNLLYYLVILVLVFRTAEAVLDRRAALVASAVTGLWPSLLLHSTQLLKDPLLIVAMLALVLVLCRLQADAYTVRGALAAGVGASVAVVVLWIVRTSMWDAVRLMVLLGIVLSLIPQLRGRRVRAGNAVTACLLIATVFLLPLFRESLNSQRALTRRLSWQLLEDLPLEERIGLRREWSNGVDDEGTASGSAIDTDVEFRGRADMLRYLPRAAQIGFLAPFTDMWLGQGARAGSSGRLLSGFEMLLTYALELLALVCVWQRRREVGAWFLLLVSAGGVVGLGLVVRNVGTLYRLRYPFWVLLVILGAGGAAHLFSKARARKYAR